MKEGFRPDFGLHLKELFSNNGGMTFMGFDFTEILRIAPEQYIIFTYYVYNGTEYALSLDFSIWQLNELFDLMQPHFNDNDFKNIVSSLLSMTKLLSKANWTMPIPGICCQAKLGELQINNNEKYIPFIVEKFY